MITEAFIIEILVSDRMELIVIRDGSIDISGNGAPFYSRDSQLYYFNLFISLIFTSDV